MNGKKHALSLGMVIVGAAVLASLTVCKKTPLTATAGSELSISANPTAIPAIGGVSTITVVGFRGDAEAGGGGPLPNGTQIFFTTNVGVIEERVEMINGVARGFLRSDGRAGLAMVEARSGAGVTSGPTEVRIGNAEGINILVTANPATVRPPDFTSNIVATVFDNSNNPLSDVPVVFSTNAGALASNGSILRTNQLGQASDRLTLENETSATVTVTSGAVSASVSVSRGNVNNPTLSSVFPSSGAPGETLNVTITGLNFQPGAAVSFGQGIAINNVNFVSSTQLVANISIDPDARVETTGRTVTVTNPDGSSGSLSDAFRVLVPGAAPSPQILGVNPFTGSRGDDLDVTITGTDFQNTPNVGFGSGILVNTVTFNSSTNLTVNISIDPLATPGFRDVSVINPDGGTATFSSAFQVQSKPTITNVNPQTGTQGATLNVTITGTDFIDPPLVGFGQGITVNSVTFGSSMSVTVNITISGSATMGLRNVTVTNPDGGSAVGTNGFEVQ